MKYVIFTLAMLVIFSCKKNSESSLPGCIDKYVSQALSKPKGTMAISIDAYTYQNKTVYLYISGCCDQYDLLYDEHCTPLFAPSGGITGRGDGTHPDFFTDAVFIKSIWKDPRP